jgi:hypothetical protein
MKCGCGELVEWYWQGRPKVLGERTASVPLCSPQVARNIPGSKPGLRCVRLMSNRWSHRRNCSTCVFNFEVDKPTNYHFLALFHFINKICLIRHFMWCNGVPENIRQVKISLSSLHVWLETFLKIMGFAKVSLPPAKRQIPNVLFNNCFLQKEASLETPRVPN